MFHLESIPLTQKILKLITKIDHFKGVWSTLKVLSPERLTILRKVATIESIGSSIHIEGSKLSNRDIEKLLLYLDIHQFVSRSEQEVADYAEVMELRTLHNIKTKKIVLKFKLFEAQKAPKDLFLAFKKSSAVLCRGLELIFQSWENIPLTENYIKQRQHYLLRFSIMLNLKEKLL